MQLTMRAKAELERLRAGLNASKAAARRASIQYDRECDRFNADWDDYKARLDSYNAQVDSWNSNGGAPEDAIDELELEKIELTSGNETLQARHQALEALRLDLSSKAALARDKTTEYNRAVESYNQNYVPLAPDTVGECVRGSTVQRVIVYAFESDEDLAVVLAHELGHALGLSHVRGEGSLMSAVNRAGAARLRLSREDRKALKALLAR